VAAQERAHTQVRPYFHCSWRPESPGRLVPWERSSAPVLNPLLCPKGEEPVQASESTCLVPTRCDRLAGFVTAESSIRVVLCSQDPVKESVERVL